MPEQIGKYRIVERIGRGGMGTVYKAHDPVLDRMVALKVISSEGDVTEELKARFYREAQACAKLSHPNIVVVHDLGEDSGQLFIVMEFLDGQELKYLIERQRLSLEEKLSLMVQVCDGFHFAHQKGIIHRDIKPGNIFVLRNGQVKILDFGIARIAAGTDPGLTRTGLIMGTLRYMSPEQARGRVDHRSDIFSIGAVFYELLGGRPVFDSPDPMEILEKIRSEQPVPLVELDPTIPPELASLVERAIRKDPAQRFPDLGQMRAQIEGVRRGFTDEGDRLQGQVRAQFDRFRELQASLGRLLGRSLDDETTPVLTDGTGLDELRTLAQALAGRIEDVEARVFQAEALESGIARGQELLRAGDPSAAVEEFARVLQEVPEHARAQEGLRQAQSAEPAAPKAPEPALPKPPEPLLRRAPQPAAMPKAPEGPRPAAPAVRVPGRPATPPAPAAPTREAPAPRPRPGGRGRVAAGVLGALVVLGFGVYLFYPSAPPTPAPVVVAPTPIPAPAPAPAPAPTPILPAPGAPGREAAEKLRKLAVTAREAATRQEAERLAPALWASAVAKEREADRAIGRQEFPQAEAAYKDAQQGYEQAADQAQQAVVLVAKEFEASKVQERAQGARQAAEQTEAAKRAPPLWARATGIERDAEVALKRQDFDRAQTLWGQAEEAYRRAEAEARQQKATAALPPPKAAPPPAPPPDTSAARQAVERARSAVMANREQALRSGADRLAKELVDVARAKEAEASALEGQQQFVAATQAYQDAAQRYWEAVSRARIARVAQSEADQARGRMLAEKQRARPDAWDFRAGVEEEQTGDARYEVAAFKEAAAHFRVARGLFARAVGATADAPPTGGDPRAEIRAVLDSYRQAIERKDTALLQKVRPGLNAADVRASFDQTRSHQVELAIQSIDLNGDQAEAKGLRRDVVVQPDGRTFRNESAFAFKLRRIPAGWVIDAVN
jgi:predicted Ser/Thr protein kinase